MHQKLNWKDFQDKNQLESILLQDILNIAKNAISENGSFKIVMAGGSTPESYINHFSMFVIKILVIGNCMLGMKDASQ